LPFFDIPSDIKDHLDKPDIFWFKLSCLKQMNGEVPFLNISNFALGVLCLPHSNADCQRIFSKINLIKLKTRNRLNTDTIQGCIFASQEIKMNTNNCVDYHPTKKMINSMTSQNVYEKENKERIKDEFDFESD